ncbi:MAG: DAK2 domain-containing protein [Clostridia bacterium]|nr:DAK2 domain-containing protein [Clostridia bacterium]
MKINGSLFRSMVVSAGNALENAKQKINDLNVFPVPDGDTGINMSMTLGGVSAAGREGETVEEVSKEIASAALRSARGNSGVILSLFFRGVSRAFKEIARADVPDVARAFTLGTEEAYKSVSNPTEGTILTVMRCSSEAAEKLAGKKLNPPTLEELFDKILDVARETLDKTPEMLPVLKQAGVVDSGGMGFVVVLEGMIAALHGKPVALDEERSENAGSVFGKFSTEDIVYPYCTECIVGKSPDYKGEGTCGDFRSFVLAAGDSAVFVDDEEIVKIHVHTSDPGKVLSEAVKYGALLTVKVENMREQHTSLVTEKKPSPVAVAAGKIEGAAARTVNYTKQLLTPKEAKAEKEYGFVSVCTGEGIVAAFRDLGADKIVKGGQTMNPSTNDVLTQVRATPSKVVFVLPNNKNICMVAAQAALLEKKKKVVVIPTYTIQEGIAVMMAFDPDADLDANKSAMEEAMKNVSSLSVTRAIRDSVVNGETVRQGEFLGLLRGKIVCHKLDRTECLSALLAGVKGATFLTVFRGAGVSEEEGEEVVKLIGSLFGRDAEATSVDGGQPLYDFLISAE